MDQALTYTTKFLFCCIHGNGTVSFPKAMYEGEAYTVEKSNLHEKSYPNKQFPLPMVVTVPGLFEEQLVDKSAQQRNTGG